MMLAHRQRKLYFIVFLLLGLSLAVGLALYALRQNISLYYTPAQIPTNMPLNQNFRLGGLVVKGSVKRQAQTLQVQFDLTDWHKTITVQYTGILPSLFREGQGIVAEGHLTRAHVFLADQVLAKHDENYHPPHIQDKP